MTITESDDAAAKRARQRNDWDLAAPGWRRGQEARDPADRTVNEVTAQLLALAGIRSGQRVLDLACGVGEPAFVIAEHVGPTGAVLGLDLSTTMVEGVQALAGARGIPNAEFRRIESELELGVPDGGFDAATCRFGLMFTPDPDRALATLRRALKPGGRIAVSTWGPPEQVRFLALATEIVGRHVALPPFDPTAPGLSALPTPAALRRVFAAAGFADVEVVGVTVPFLAESPAAFWDAQEEGCGPILGMLAASPPAARRAIREDAIRTVGAMFPGGGVRLESEALVAGGVNPG
ncbi:MAG TPA: class I SAM-dependent methyltransferase [Thermomicrobiales bacterium]|jgi:ubiquinone/menaquinone biosynthesis C-methylase UbiE